MLIRLHKVKDPEKVKKEGCQFGIKGNQSYCKPGSDGTDSREVTGPISHRPGEKEEQARFHFVSSASTCALLSPSRYRLLCNSPKNGRTQPTVRQAEQEESNSAQSIASLAEALREIVAVQRAMVERSGDIRAY
ncbi:UNVERIFIED_CONTAM: hypothetical protein FKN15_071693 [Acipenser sinensis]